MKSFLHCVFDHLQENHHNKDTRKTKNINREEQKSNSLKDNSNDDDKDDDKDDDDSIKGLYVIKENKNITICENKKTYDFYVSFISEFNGEINYFGSESESEYFRHLVFTKDNKYLFSGVENDSTYIQLQDNCILHAEVRSALLNTPHNITVFSTEQDDGFYYNDVNNVPNFTDNMFKIKKNNHQNKILHVEWLKGKTKSNIINLNDTPIYAMMVQNYIDV